MPCTPMMTRALPISLSSEDGLLHFESQPVESCLFQQEIALAFRRRELGEFLAEQGAERLKGQRVHRRLSN